MSIHEDLPKSSSGQRWIRLLRLEAGSGTDGIACRFEEDNQFQGVQLGKQAKYEALSYRWGNKDEREWITCNNKQFSITRDLAVSLHFLRRPDRSRILWVDQICINQENPAEKQSQVGLMSSVYLEAQQVVVWLGNETASTPLAFSFLHILAGAGHDYPEHGDQHRLNASERNLLRMPAQDPEKMKAFTEVLSYEWFARMWIIQEIVCGQSIVVRCGHSEMRWDRFIDGITYGQNHQIWKRSAVIEKNLNCCANLVMVLSAQSAYSRAGVDAPQRFQLDLLGMLDICRPSIAGDYRDKIYGLYGMCLLPGMRRLAADFDAIGIEPDYCTKWDVLDPDYRMEVSDLYQRVVFGLIRWKGALDILSMPRFDTETRMETLPTWVADLRFDEGHSLMNPLINLQENPRTYFNAAWYSEAYAELNDKILTLSGYEYDIVADTASFEALEEDIGPKIQRQAEWNTFQRRGRHSPRYWLPPEKKEGRLDVYWQTLICCDHPEFDEGIRIERRLFRQHFDAYHRLFPLTKACLLLAASCGVLTDILFGSSSLPFWTCLLLDRFLVEPLQRWWYHGIPERFTAYRKGGRRLARTKKGLLALVPASTMPGDSIGIFQGGKTPLIYRPHPSKDGNLHEYVGDAYIHGIMRGEAYDATICRKIRFV